MALDPSFLDEIRQRVSLVKVIGRRNKLVRSGRNWKICCPFHGEKTPSLHIYDDHHYHCYGCQAHGDVVSYVMQSEGYNFIEAVEKLAAEAGLEVPKLQDPASQERAKKAQSLSELLAYVQKIYRRRLYENDARGALNYLKKRALTEETLERFGIGWVGSERTLLDDLRNAGFSIEQCKQSGLFRLDERGEIKGALFFNRVMFPIRDRRGRIISFGGRVIGDGAPKYLNGPETPLFSKRRSLFNLDLASIEVRKGAPLLVVEGYMDVISLDQSGFKGAVAPLGTALGETQLELLWRMSPEPILCLDGDQAGLRASLRTCEVAMPLLSDNKTLRFCRLEGGDDPDSFVKREGAAAMEARLKIARPLVEEVFMLLTSGEEDPSPEKRAGLRKQLMALAAAIKDKTLSSEYRSTLLDLFFQRYRKHPYPKGGNSRGWHNVQSSHTQLNEIFSQERSAIIEGKDVRLRILISLLLYYPSLFLEVEQAYMQLPLPSALEEVRVSFLEWVYQGGDLKREACFAWMEEKNLGKICHEIISAPLLRLVRPLEEAIDFDLEEILQIWWHFYGLVNFAQFEAEVQKEVQEEIIRAYERPLEKQSESESGLCFPPKLAARMRVLDALRRGEKIETEEDF